MSNTRFFFLIASIHVCLLVQSTVNAQVIDEDTGCPLNVNHVCDICTQGQTSLGCYCELPGDDIIVTANIFTACPTNDQDPCLNNSCKNGATCVRENLSDYKCLCAVGFGGVLCNETLPKCSDANIKCINAECVETNNQLAPVYCQCYDGTRRDPRQNDTCPPSPCFKRNTEESVCENNGTCRAVGSSYTCQCAKGWSGVNCTKQLKAPYCEDSPGVCGEGRCQQTAVPSLYSCLCGTHPNTYAKDIKDLVRCEQSGCYSSNPCQNGGTCSNKGVGAFICQCPPRFVGSKCEKRSACFNNPCLNNGICEAFNETVFFCKCPSYFTGQRCEISVPNPCIKKNCGSFGQCEDLEGVGVCRCNDGLHLDGSPCLDPCFNTSCNTGVCTKKPNATYEAMCSCPVDRQGNNCELPRNPCREAPNCGGGYCKPNYSSPRGFICVCQGGVTRNEPCPFSATCPIKNCGTQGVCVETDGIVVTPGTRPIYYVCVCKKGYITSSDCDDLINNKETEAATRCGPNGKPYPSRNPNSPFGCWCNNGTHIPEIQLSDAVQHCP